MKLILGSGSASRKDVLAAAGYAFDVMSPNIDESAIRDEDPRALVLKLANAKADALVPAILEPAILITSDQVVVCGARILEKPKDEAEAREFLRLYRDHPMETVSALVVTNTQTGKRVEGVEVARVWFSDIPESLIDHAISDGRVMACAGAMRSEHSMFAPYIVKAEGGEDSTSGMPLELLRALLINVQV